MKNRSCDQVEMKPVSLAAGLSFCHRLILWFLAAFLAVCAAFMGNMNRGLMETTEGRYAECAREMVETGNYLEPTLNYAPHWTKPPMAYWSMAAGIKILGNTEAGVRLASGLAFLGTVVLTAMMAWRLWGERAAFLAFVVYISSVLPVLGATMLSTDMLLTWWETLAVALYLFWAFPGVPPRADGQDHSGPIADWRIHLCWAAFGLAFLTKGPPALLPLLCLLPWHWWRFRNLCIFSLPGLILFSVCAFSWFGLMAWRHPGLLSYYLLEEIAGRVTTDAFDRNPEWYNPFLIYVPLLILGQAHWLWILWQRQARWHRLGGMERSIRIFLLLWLFLPLLVFCLSKSRLPLYILPLSVPLTLFLAFFLNRGVGAHMRPVLSTCAAAVFVLCVMRWISGVLPLPENMRHLAEIVRQEEAARPAPLTGLLTTPAYGLQFYMQKEMNWLEDRGGREETLRGYLAGLKAPERLVIKEKYTALVYLLCARARVRVTERLTGEYGIFYLEPEVAQSPGEAGGAGVPKASTVH